MLYDKLIFGDCMEELEKLDDCSIDCVITDPPYGTNDKYGKQIKRGNVHTSFNVLEWDKELPTDFLKHIYRVMKNDSWGFIFVDKKEITTVWNELEKYNLSPRNTFYWIKNNKAPTLRKNFKSSVEVAIVFTKGRTTIKWKGGANQNNFIVLPFVSGKEKVNHPTQKPIKLISYFIEMVTNKGDVILDPYMGSGTSCVAAKLMERNYIGMEISDEYFKLAEKRLDTLSIPIKNNFY